MNKSVMKCCICNNENIGEFVTINDKKYHLCCIEQLQQENQELKRQLEEYKEQVSKGLYNICLPYKNGYDKAIKYKENQQKEFIDYLTSYIELLSNKPDLIEESEIDLLKEILSKFKEIKES